jgi:DNA ligase 1
LRSVKWDYAKGIHLCDAGIWLDPQRSKPFAFVSHAHSDHVARHQQILCSPVTAHLLHVRYRIAHDRLTSLPFFETREINGFLYQLLPAGHIAGSAMIHITELASGATLLYTGDFKLRSSRAAEATVCQPADTLIMESTFGLPHYVLPPAEQIEAQLLDFVRKSIEQEKSPILLGYSLGKAQEISAILAAHQQPFVVYHTIAAMTHACRAAGLELPVPIDWQGEIPRGHALIAPPQALREPAIAGLKNTNSAILTGWAMDAAAKFRYRSSTAIPLSDHADFPDLLRLVDLVKPKKIITIHGSTRELAASLRSRGHEAWSIYGGDQLEFSLGE